MLQGEIPSERAIFSKNYGVNYIFNCNTRWPQQGGSLLAFKNVSEVKMIFVKTVACEFDWFYQLIYFQFDLSS